MVRIGRRRTKVAGQRSKRGKSGGGRGSQNGSGTTRLAQVRGRGKRVLPRVQREKKSNNLQKEKKKKKKLGTHLLC